MRIGAPQSRRVEVHHGCGGLTTGHQLSMEEPENICIELPVEGGGPVLDQIGRFGAGKPAGRIGRDQSATESHEQLVANNFFRQDLGQALRQKSLGLQQFAKSGQTGEWRLPGRIEHLGDGQLEHDVGEGHEPRPHQTLGKQG